MLLLAVLCVPLCPGSAGSLGLRVGGAELFVGGMNLFPWKGR